MKKRVWRKLFSVLAAAALLFSFSLPALNAAVKPCENYAEENCLPEDTTERGNIGEDSAVGHKSYCLSSKKCWDSSVKKSHCPDSHDTQTNQIPNPDCIQKATIDEPIFFNDGGSVKLKGTEICSRDCAAEGTWGTCEPESSDVTELIPPDPSEAKLVLTNENNVGGGKTVVKLTVIWGDPDNSEGQCDTCQSVCISGAPGNPAWCVSGNLDKRQWVEDEDLGNYCCGDDGYTNPPSQNTADNDNPDKSKAACVQCKKTGSSDIGPGARVWLGDDPEIFSDLTWNKCCGDDDVAMGTAHTDDPDRSLSSCNKCKIGTLNKNTPTKRSWDASVADPNLRCCGDDNGDDPDASLIQCEGKGDQEPCPIGVTIEGRIWADRAKDDTRNAEGGTGEEGGEGETPAPAVKPEVGCCGDDKNEKWCAGQTIDGGCFNRQFYGPGYEDIDNKEVDTEGFMCKTCTTRKTSAGEILPGEWVTLIEAATAVGAAPVAAVPAGAPCCGDDPGETWCISQNSGCYSLGEYTDIATEPDSNAWLCITCATLGMTPATRAWDPVSVGSNCCGDDAEDCGEQPASGRLCGNIDGEFSWSWIIAADEEGNVKELPCNKRQYLATDSDWLECGKSGWGEVEESDDENGDDGGNSKYLVEDIGGEPHDYLCVKGEVIECCGDSGCNSDGDVGKQKEIGESQKAGGDTYYCTTEGKWKTNLDDDQETCEAALDEDENPLIWTGRYCCSEAEDYPEYYNDEDSEIGACWESKLLQNGQAVSYPGKGIGDIVVSAGVFQGCKVSANNFNSENDGFLNISDTQTHENLITDHNYCASLEIKLYPDAPGIKTFCSYQEEWKLFTVFSSRPYLSTIIWRDNNTETQTSECCPNNYCWIGNYTTMYGSAYDIIDGCAEDMSSNPGEDAVFNAPDEQQYRCIKGSWEIPDIKVSPRGRRGFCPSPSMCLVDPYGDPKYNGNTSVNAFPVCVNDGQYLDGSDFFCRAGDWTTRTSFIAEEMLKIDTSNYTIACGSSDEVLNFVDYFSNQSYHMYDYLYYANNLCVMKTDEAVVVGASLNRGADSTFLSFLEAIGKLRTYCDNAKVSDGAFKVCSGADVYYNFKYKLLIFSKEPISFAGGGGWAEFLNRMQVIESDVLPEVSPEVYGDMGIFKDRRYYSTIFLDRHGDKETAGLLTSPTLGQKVLAVSYNGFDAEICPTIEKYNTNNRKKIFCTQPGVNAYIMTNDASSSRIFSELGKELRVG